MVELAVELGYKDKKNVHLIGDGQRLNISGNGNFA
jgi:hypothetical protein